MFIKYILVWFKAIIYFISAIYIKLWHHFGLVHGMAWFLVLQLSMVTMILYLSLAYGYDIIWELWYWLLLFWQLWLLWVLIWVLHQIMSSIIYHVNGHSLLSTISYSNLAYGLLLFFTTTSRAQHLASCYYLLVSVQAYCISGDWFTYSLRAS